MTPIHDIVVASDLSPRGTLAVRRAVRLAQAQKAPLTVVTVSDDAMPEAMTKPLAEQARMTLHALLGDLDADARVLVEVGDPTEAILRQSEAADLLIMGCHRPRSFLSELKETTMERIARRTSTPVLLAMSDPAEDYRSAIAACDFSPASNAAMQLTHVLAPDVDITPIHAVHVPYAGRLAASGPSATMLEASFVQETERFAATWRNAAPLPAQITQRLEVITGAPDPVLRQRCAEEAPALLCLGAHGRVGAHRSLMGSLALDMMRDPPCDVLIARPL